MRSRRHGRGIGIWDRNGVTNWVGICCWMMIERIWMTVWFRVSTRQGLGMDNDTDMVGLWISIWARIRARSMIGCPLGIVSGCALDTHAGDAGLMSRVLGLLTLWWSDRIGGRMGFGFIIGIWTGTWIYRY